MSSNISTTSGVHAPTTTSVSPKKNQNIEGANSLAETTETNVSTVSLSSTGVQKSNEDTVALPEENIIPSDLKLESKRILAQITLTSDAAVLKANQEVPNTDDPVLLARAKQATSFFTSNSINPFSGLSRDKLSAIMFDDSGAYTINERRAAGSEQAKQDTAYWMPILTADAISGNHQTTYKVALDFYEKMSPLERASRDYPADYVSTTTKLLEAEQEKSEDADTSDSIKKPNLEKVSDTSAANPFEIGSGDSSAFKSLSKSLKAYLSK